MATVNTPNNRAAWIVGEKKSPLEVQPGPEHTPAATDVVIKVAYAAVNPTDHVMQDTPYVPLQYPNIFGTDVSGTVVALGTDVTRFNIGQRVIAHCDSLMTHQPSRAGFQSYTTCREILVAAIPDSLPLAAGAVLPLSISTAAAGLFNNLALPFPALDPVPSGKTVLIWGGSSSCGSSSIQLAVAAGYKVAATAGKANQEYVRSLGASFAFDYKDPKVVEKIVQLFKTEQYAGILACIADPASQIVCQDIVHKLGGGSLPMLLFPRSENVPEDVKPVLVFASDPGINRPEIGDAVWRKYIPQALAAGKFQAKPDPLVLYGLEKVQEGIDLLRRGVSARKIVIEVAKTD